MHGGTTTGIRAAELATGADLIHCVTHAAHVGLLGPLPESRPHEGVLKAMKGAPYREKPGDQPSSFLFLAIVEGGHGPYGYKWATPKAADPVHDVVVSFTSGRKLGLISYGKHARQIPKTEICGADGAVCFPAYT
ncbi:hypothetical protein [Streptomyces sp. NPDC051214]|uniref:hypothetical protein n=1 Tax=Streptomyces sp. NPDC051214 TaxID=3155282 RepID=UPI0034375757